MFFFDSGYLLFVFLPTLVISGLTQLFIRNAYSKWGQTPNSRNVNGVGTAQAIMQNYGLGHVRLQGAQGKLADHYSPREQVVRLSPQVANQPSVASMAIAAHEFGHVQQWSSQSLLIGAREFLVPGVRFGSGAALWLIILGLFMNFTGLALIGLGLFGLAVLFSILTLPIEIDASRRALKMLNDMGFLVTEEDRRGARSMLTAAALTYVGAMVVSIITFLYYASLVMGRRD